MALYSHGPAGHPVRQWTILGHASLSPNLPVFAPRHPDAYTLWPIPAKHPAVLEYQRLPPEEFQSSVGGLDDFDWIVELYDGN